jgi:hypothetical protein
MQKMSSKLMFSAVASTLAMAALALGAPSVEYSARESAGWSPLEAGMPAPSLATPYLLPR